MKDLFVFIVIMVLRKESIQRELKMWFKIGFFFFLNEKKGRINMKWWMKREEFQNLIYFNVY